MPLQRIVGTLVGESGMGISPRDVSLKAPLSLSQFWQLLVMDWEVLTITFTVFQIPCRGLEVIHYHFHSCHNVIVRKVLTVTFAASTIPCTVLRAFGCQLHNFHNSLSCFESFWLAASQFPPFPVPVWHLSTISFTAVTVPCDGLGDFANQIRSHIS